MQPGIHDRALERVKRVGRVAAALRLDVAQQRRVVRTQRVVTHRLAYAVAHTLRILKVGIEVAPVLVYR